VLGDYHGSVDSFASLLALALQLVFQVRGDFVKILFRQQAISLLAMGSSGYPQLGQASELNRWIQTRPQ